MSPLAELLRALGAAFSDLEAEWYLFGAQAAVLHGAARLTADVDVTVAPGSRPTADLAAALAAHGFAPRVEDLAAFAERTRVLPVAHEPTGIPVDVVVAGPGLEERFLSRREHLTVEGVPVPVARAEDLIAMKLLAGRAKDVDDAVAVTAAQGGRLDVALIRETLATLERALDRSDLGPLLDEILRRAAS